ncbi:MAG TPA: hypothetical protein P5052_03255 [Candidatus Paceibacterota bacterium]|nr:hypothetical protein [Candidatus Paceibacterota bacterium]
MAKDQVEVKVEEEPTVVCNLIFIKPFSVSTALAACDTLTPSSQELL